MSLSNTERELTALGVSVAAGCKPCTVHHLRAAREVGVTDEEMKDAVAVALSVRNHATELMGRFESLRGADSGQECTVDVLWGEKPLVADLRKSLGESGGRYRT